MPGDINIYRSTIWLLRSQSRMPACLRSSRNPSGGAGRHDPSCRVITAATES
jgi:hypothetical protein